VFGPDEDMTRASPPRSHLSPIAEKYHSDNDSSGILVKVSVPATLVPNCGSTSTAHFLFLFFWMSSRDLKLCWIPEGAAYRLAEIATGYGTSEYGVKYLDPSGKAAPQIIKINSALTFSVDSLEELSNPPSDLIQLSDVHRPGILHTLQERFKKDLVYTSIGPILISLNPFRWIEGVYEDEIKMKYYNETLNLSENPHVFAMAHDALMGLQFGKNQSLIISGESGAGKTEATKQCLNYLAVVAGSSTGVHNRILLANPILESWGNAKTLRNNNSSRFGKFIEILMSRGGEIVGSSNTTYLLEKSRVVFQESGERSYHVFYQLLFGAPDSLLAQFHLLEMKNHPNEVAYINQSGCLRIEGVDDAADYQEVVEAQSLVGFPEGDSQVLLQMIAGILHLGNLHYEVHPSDSEESMINPQTEPSLLHASRLFGLDLVTFRRSLLFKSVRSGKRKSVTYAPYSPVTAIENRDALAKEIYNRCFDFIVGTINTKINIDAEKLAAMDTSMIGVLDIFGFEIFKKVGLPYTFPCDSFLPPLRSSLSELLRATLHQLSQRSSPATFQRSYFPN
jgi:myosin heavy subunit